MNTEKEKKKLIDMINEFEKSDDDELLKDIKSLKKRLFPKQSKRIDELIAELLEATSSEGMGKREFTKFQKEILFELDVLKKEIDNLLYDVPVKNTKREELYQLLKSIKTRESRGYHFRERMFGKQGTKNNIRPFTDVDKIYLDKYLTAIGAGF